MYKNVKESRHFPLFFSEISFTHSIHSSIHSHSNVNCNPKSYDDMRQSPRGMMHKKYYTLIYTHKINNLMPQNTCLLILKVFFVRESTRRRLLSQQSSSLLNWTAIGKLSIFWNFNICYLSLQCITMQQCVSGLVTTKAALNDNLVCINIAIAEWGNEKLRNCKTAKTSWTSILRQLNKWPWTMKCSYYDILRQNLNIVLENYKLRLKEAHMLFLCLFI